MPKDFAIAVALSAFFLSRAGAAEKPDGGLFNGRDLAGWTYHLADPNVKMEDVWSVKDGVLHCTGQPAGYLVTKKNDFENYVLTVRMAMARQGRQQRRADSRHEAGRARRVAQSAFEVQLQSGEAGEFWVIGTTLEIEQPDRSHRRPPAQEPHRRQRENSSVSGTRWRSPAAATK